METIDIILLCTCAYLLGIAGRILTSRGPKKILSAFIWPIDVIGFIILMPMGILWSIWHVVYGNLNEWIRKRGDGSQV